MRSHLPVWKRTAFRWTPIWDAIEEAWRSRWLGYFFLAVAVAFTLVWEFRVPAPGHSLIAMGVAAGLMALRPDMQGREKWLWTVALFALAHVEIRAIKADRARHDNEQAALSNQLKQNFTDIGDGIKGAVAESDRNFKETIDRQNELLGNITGADTYCVVEAVPVGDRFLLSAIAVGPNPLREVMIDQVDLDLERDALEKRSLTYDVIHSFTTSYPSIPFLVSTSGHQLNELPFGSGDERNFHFNFFTTSGVWGETLNLRRVNGIWIQAFRVTKQVPAAHHQTRDVVLHTNIPSNYPKINGQTDW
jgi:hypothetical protein